MSLQTIKNELTKDLTLIGSRQVEIGKESQPFIFSPCLTIYLGKIGSGKSNLIMNLLEKKSSPYHKFFKHIWLVSPSARYDDKMADLVQELDEEKKYYSDLNNDVLKEIYDRNQAILEAWTEKKNKKSDLNNLLILDDCIHAIKGNKSVLLNEIVTRLRHIRLNIWITSQKYNFIPTIIRNQISQMGIFRTENQHELKTIMEEIGCDHNKFLKAYEFSTLEPFSFLWIKINPRCIYFKGFDRIVF